MSAVTRYQPFDYKYAKRAFLYRDEPPCVRSLSMTTKCIGESLRKVVDIEGGWLHLQGHAPDVAIRHHWTGVISRSDFRIVKRSIAELLDVGFLVLGELDDQGEFVPLGSGDYLAIRDWVPSQTGMTRAQAAEYYAEQDARAARYVRQRLDDATIHDSAAPPAPTASPPPATAIGVAGGAERDVTAHSQRTDETPERHRPCTDRSPSGRNSNGTELALFHTIPYQYPPISPQGDRRAGFDSVSSERPEPQPPPGAVESLAHQAVDWLNRQHSPPTQFTPDSPDTRKRAAKWHQAGWDWPAVRAALELRLKAQQATHPHDWRNWVKPGTFFNAKLRHFAEEAQAGHRYRVDAPGRSGGDAAQAAQRARQQISAAQQRRHEDAERAFADVLQLAQKVGPDGDWAAQLRHSTARSTVRDVGWKRIVQLGDAMRVPFIARFVGGPGHVPAAAAA